MRSEHAIGRRVSGAGLILIVVLLGCSKPPFEIAPVEVVVTLDGAPLPGGRVMMTPVTSTDALESGKPGVADLGPDGRASVSTYGNGDGAVVGEHTIKLINTEPDSESGRLLRAQRVPVPGRWTVEADRNNELTIAVTSEMIARLGQRRED